MQNDIVLYIVEESHGIPNENVATKVMVNMLKITWNLIHSESNRNGIIEVGNVYKGGTNK